MTVLVAGAGPAGLTVAAELALAGTEVEVVDAAPARSPHPRGSTLSARSLELLDRRGLLERFLAEGPVVPHGMFLPGLPLDLSVMDTDHPYTLGIAQNRVEELLEEWLAELGVRVRWGCGVVDLRQDDDGVDVVVGQERRRVSYLVGCDGSRSVVRKRADWSRTSRPTTTHSRRVRCSCCRGRDTCGSCSTSRNRATDPWRSSTSSRC